MHAPADFIGFVSLVNQIQHSGIFREPLENFTQTLLNGHYQFGDAFPVFDQRDKFMIDSYAQIVIPCLFLLQIIADLVPQNFQSPEFEPFVVKINRLILFNHRSAGVHGDISGIFASYSLFGEIFKSNNQQVKKSLFGFFIAIFNFTGQALEIIAISHA